MKDLLDKLILDNPMSIEIIRFRRRFMTFSGPNAVNTAVALLVFALYAGLNLLVVSYATDVNPIIILFLQLFLFCIFAPSLLHGAVAGERERRSWDLLLVAPVTKAQIVVGKFLGAAAALAGFSVAMLLPLMIAALSYSRTDLLNVIIAELMTQAFALMLCAFTLFISARVKRPFMAMGIVVACLALGLLILPGMAAVIVGGDQLTADLLFYFNPFYAIGKMESNGFSGSLGISSVFYGIPHILVYLFMTGVFLAWAINTLTFAENDVRFIPKSAKDA
ncbi:hypothetical protein EON79_00735 [bacterium]|nr:MAG: hypothetical protein EON79_00735 [bacterium]